MRIGEKFSAVRLTAAWLFYLAPIEFFSKAIIHIMQIVF
jgi:hypothetical protein